MKKFWDERYSDPEYVYGTGPNEFLRQELPRIGKGKILFPGEGEGRNAVYAAAIGWEVYAYDYSSVGREKALKLAANHNAFIHYDVFSHDEASYPQNSFDVIGLFYVHSPQHASFHAKLNGFLKPGGVVIMEAFSKEQLNYKSGGPGDVAMLYSEDEIKSDFSDFQSLKISKEIVQLNEGKFHQGVASVLRMIALK